MGNNFSASVRAFIVNCATSGKFLFDLLKKVVILPLYPLTFPRLFEETEGGGITQWENSSHLIGSVQVNWFEDSTKSIIYFFCYNPIMDRVLTIAIVQAKCRTVRPEVFFYITAPETGDIIGLRFQTGLNTHEFWDFFNQMM